MENESRYHCHSHHQAPHIIGGACEYQDADLAAMPYLRYLDTSYSCSLRHVQYADMKTQQ